MNKPNRIPQFEKEKLIAKMRASFDELNHLWIEKESEKEKEKENQLAIQFRENAINKIFN